MPNEFRPIWVYADDNEIAHEMRVRVKGRSNLTLLPDFFVVDLYNIISQDVAILKRAKMLMVRADDGAIVCNGEIEGIYVHEEGANTVTTVSVSDGQSFWGTSIDMSIGAGARMLDAVRTAISGIIAPGGFYCDDIRLTRGQTISGRVADFVSTAARSLGARAYVTNNVLSIVSKGRGANMFTLYESDVIGSTEELGDAVLIVQIRTKSYTVGDIVNYQNKQRRIIARSINLDNLEGDWNVEITLADESAFSVKEMEGGW